jgi:hypothetical protein
MNFRMPAKSSPIFLLLLLTCSTGCVTQQRYADLLREVEQKEKHQLKMTAQLQELQTRNERLRDSLALYPN